MILSTFVIIFKLKSQKNINQFFFLSLNNIEKFIINKVSLLLIFVRKEDLLVALKNIANTRVQVYQRSELLDRNELFLSYREGVSAMFSVSYRL